eukprot:GHUV01037355.1.p1 GENE.GHUV01037355.1~~GHUV01037355.1.p1  ORF type:complete len:180 (-),score=18.62 GHUV01037355.1:126-665(-)
MFNKDQLALAVHLARNLLPAQFPTEEWSVFLNCSSSLSDGAANTASKRESGSRPGTAASSTPSWVRAESADAYEQIAAALPGLVATAQLQEGRIWAPWAASTASVVGPGDGGVEFVPAAVAGRLSGLQQLTLVAAFRPDRYVLAQMLTTLAVGQACDGSPVDMAYMHASTCPQHDLKAC